MAERLKAAVLKTVERESVPWVRIPVPPPPSPADARTSGSLEGCPPISSLDSGDFSGYGRGAGEVSRAWGKVAAGVRVIVSRARFGGPGF